MTDNSGSGKVLQEVLDGSVLGRELAASAWDGLSVEQQLAILATMGSLDVSLPVVEKALGSSNEFIRYRAAKLCDYLPTLTPRIKADSSPLVRGVASARRWGPFDAPPSPSEFAALPHLERLSTIRNLSSPAIKWSHVDFLRDLVRGAALPEAELTQVLVEWVRTHGGRIIHGPNCEFGPGRDSREDELHAAWALVRELPEAVAVEFATFLGWHERDDIPTYETLSALPPIVQIAFLEREDVEAWNIRMRYLLEQPEDSPTIASACTGMRLNDRHFANVAARGERFVYRLARYAKLWPMQVQEATRVLGYEFANSRYEGSAGDWFPLGWTRMGEVLWSSLVECPPEDRGRALLSMQCHALARKLVQYADHPNLVDHYATSIKSRVVAEDVFATALGLRDLFEGRDLWPRCFLPDVRALLPEAPSRNDRLLSQIREAGLSEWLEVREVESARIHKAVCDPTLQRSTVDIDERLRSCRRDRTILAWLFGPGLILGGLYGLYLWLPTAVQLSAWENVGQFGCAGLIGWFATMVYREMVPEQDQEIERLLSRRAEVGQPWEDEAQRLDWLASELFKLAPEQRALAGTSLSIVGRDRD